MLLPEGQGLLEEGRVVVEEKAGWRGAGPGLQQSKGEDCAFPDRPPTETEVTEVERSGPQGVRHWPLVTCRLEISPMSADGISRQVFKSPTQSNRWLGSG